MISQSTSPTLLGANGSMPMPWEMSGNAMSRIDMLIVTIRTPIVVFERPIHR